jgi:YfiH family protein
MEWREAGGVGWLEASLPGARAAFSTRAGGVSSAPFESLNLGAFAGDEVATVAENRRRLAEALELTPSRVAVGRQVHGTKLATHVAPQRSSPFSTLGRPIPEVDGHVTAQPDLVALVLVADCLPVALAGPGGVAMLHCGWRGLAGGIVARGVEAVGATDAAIGPGIGPCCYEVGEELLEVFGGLGDGVAAGRMLDLAEVARRQLREAGVKRIEAAGVCTSCESERFFSHRRDGGRTGRQAGLVWLEETSASSGAG